MITSNSLTYQEYFCLGNDVSDHVLEDKLYHVLWARGQEQADNFYEQDLLKKHAKNANSRGQLTINLLGEFS